MRSGLAILMLLIMPSLSGSAERMSLELSSNKRSYLLGEPITITLTLHGSGRRARACRESLGLGYTRLYVARGDEPFMSFCGESCLGVGMKRTTNTEDSEFKWTGLVLSGRRAMKLFSEAVAYRVQLENQDPKCELTLSARRFSLRQPLTDADKAVWSAMQTSPALLYVLQWPIHAVAVVQVWGKYLEQLDELLAKFPNSSYAPYIKANQNERHILDQIISDKQVKRWVETGRAAYIKDVKERHRTAAKLEGLLTNYPSSHDAKFRKVLTEIGTLWQLDRPLTDQDRRSIEKLGRDFYEPWSALKPEGLRKFLHPEFRASSGGTGDDFIASLQRNFAESAPDRKFRIEVRSVVTELQDDIPIATVEIRSYSYMGVRDGRAELAFALEGDEWKVLSREPLPPSEP